MTADGERESAGRANAHLPTGFALVPPPLMFGAMFLAGFFAQRKWFPASAASEPQALRAIGMLFTGAGLMLAFWAVGLFLFERTTIVPHGTSSRLVIRGPFRFTRNPMYVSLSLFYLGMAVLLQTWLAALLLVVPILVLRQAIIPMEEAQLGERFGDDYVQYRARVRRWV